MNSTIKNTGLYLVGNITPKIGGFVFLPLYLKFLSPVDFGIVSSMQILQMISAIIMTFSLERSIYRMYWDYKSEEDRKSFLGTIFLTIIALACVTLAVMFFFSQALNLLFTEISFFPYFSIALLSAFLSILSIITLTILQVKGRASIHTLLVFLQFLFSSMAIIYFVVWEKEGAYGYLVGSLVGVGVMLPAYCYFLKSAIVLKIDWSILKAAMRFSAPLLPGIVMAWVLNFSDRIFLERYFSLSEVGIYSLASKIASIILVFSAAFGKAYSPEYFKNASSNTTYGKNRITKTINIYLKLLLFCFFGLTLFSNEILVVFFSKEYSDAAFVIALLCLANVFSSNLFISWSFQQSKRTLEGMYFSLLTGFSNIALNLLLIPEHGMIGAAIATLLSVALNALFRYFFIRKYCYSIKINWISLMIISGGVFLILTCFYYYQIEGLILAITFKLLSLGLFLLVLSIVYRSHSILLIQFFRKSSRKIN